MTLTPQSAVPDTKAGISPPVARVFGVSKRFGATQALKDVALEVVPGEIHALVGRNGAGKSTLVSIVAGLQHPDQGTVEFNGHPAPALGDRAAWRSVVACVYQKLTVIDALSVTENLFLNRQSENGRAISWRKLHERARRLLTEWEIDVDPRTPTGELTIEQRQLLEIARALSFGARFVILDEPTARLDAAGIARLFDRIRALQRQGVTFLYISHHLQEIFELCQRVTIYRDARHIRTAPIAEITHTELVEAMTGESAAETADLRPPLDVTQPALLEVDSVSSSGFYRDVSFQVRPGEIVGLAGSAASGKFALADAIVGLQRPDAGSVRLAGRRLRLGSVPAALKAGVGFVPQDRHIEGLVEGLSIAENATMTVPRRLGRAGFISPRRRTALARDLIAELDIVPPRPEQLAGDLSGGNQQKVVAGRALANSPSLLVLMAPTAGVDVKSKQALMNAAIETASRKAGVLVVTDDLDDLRFCHRVLVLLRGELVAELSGSWDDRDLVAAMEGMGLSND